MTEQVIPQEMLEARRWVLWRYEDRGGEPTKVPYQPNGRNASSVAPQTWSSIEEVEAAEPDYDGVGFVLGDGFAGIDLDGCITPQTGTMATWAAEILRLVPDCYAEVSPSGTGVKIFGRFEGAVKGNRCSMPGDPVEGKSPGWERYTVNRYFTVTRNPGKWPGRRLADLTPAWERLDAYLGDRSPNRTEPVSYRGTDDVYLPDQLQGDNSLFRIDPELYQRWSGITDGLADTSPSAVDMAIADRLAVHGMEGADIEAALRWRRQSEDLPGKHDGYYRNTVEKALGFGEEYRKRENPIGHARQRVKEKLAAEHDGRKGAVPLETIQGMDLSTIGVPIQDIMKMDLRARWLVDGMIPKSGISLISAKPKCGKSTLARYLAACVSTGRPFLGRSVSEISRVLYVDLDGPLEVVKEHMELLGDWVPDMDLIVINPKVSEMGEEPMVAVMEELGRRPYSMVIFDTMQTVLRAKDVNDYAEMGRHFAELRRLAGEKDLSIVLVHHDRKAGGSDGDATLGSTAIWGGVDTLIGLSRDGPQRRIETSQRSGVEIDSTEIHFEDGGFEMGQNVADAEGSRRDEDREERALQLRESILDFVEEAGEEGVYKSEIRGNVTGNYSLISSAIKSLLMSGELAEVGDGRRRKLAIMVNQ